MSDVINVSEFRARARAWLEQNLEPRDPSTPQRPIRGMDTKTVEEIAPERVLQRKVYEAGYAGIPYPTEYGGQGLSAEHQAAFLEEVRAFRMPDLGVA